MKHRYFVTSAENAPLDIIPVPGEPYLFDVVFEGTTSRVDARLQDGRLSLLIEGESHTCDVLPGDGNARVSLRGHQIEVGLLDERRFLRLSRSATPADTGAEVRSPMAGRVVKLLVEPGQAVHPGQGLVIVEAMKMENEIKATRHAQVASISVKAGQSVDPGLLLVSLADLPS